MSTQTGAPENHSEADERLRDAQARYLAKHAPATRIRRVSWSGGGTQVLELGGGEPLLLLHGGMGNAFDFAPILPTLSQHFHVYAVDRPGHGLADPFNYSGVDYVAHIRTFLTQVLDALGVDAVRLVASSMGGLWATYFALAHPERVSHLVLLGAPAGSKRWVPFQIRALRTPLLGRLVVAAFMRRPTPDKTFDFFKQVLVAHAEHLDVEFLEAAAYSQRRNLPGWLGMLERAVDARGIRPELVIGERWKALRVRTAFIWGEQDAFDTPDHGEQIASSIPAGARLVRIPDAGHMPWFDDPERVANEILRALKDQPPQRQES